jgi:hypothetical protein
MKAVSALVVAGLIFLVAVVAMEMSGGALSDTFGIVRSVSAVPIPSGGSEQIANVVLSNGKQIQAKVSRPGDARPGQSVHLTLSRHPTSGGWMYEVDSEKEPAK